MRTGHEAWADRRDRVDDERVVGEEGERLAMARAADALYGLPAVWSCAICHAAWPYRRCCIKR